MPPLSIMIKPASSLCNLSCEYCFYRDVSANRKDASYGVMSNETAENLIKKSLDFADGKTVSYTFQGGEPTLAGLDFFENFVCTVKKENKKNSPVYYSIQTNGILINEKWANFFKNSNFLVGLSLDGDRQANSFRKMPDGSNSFSRILRASECFKRNGVRFNILAVLTGENAENGVRIYKYFKSKGFRYLQFIPCLRPFGNTDKSKLYMTNDQYADFLIKVFRMYAEDYAENRYVSVRQFDNWVRLYLGQPAEQCGMNGACSRQFVCESNGNVYPCDFYCTDKYLLGNVNENSFSDIAFCNTADKFLSDSNNTDKKCLDCEFYGLCRAGGCKRTRQSYDYCAAYKKFFSASLPLFKVFENNNA